MYVENQLGVGSLKPQDVWAVFSAVPSDTNLTTGGSVHFFPYKGDFYFAVGKSLWRKKHRNTDDPEVKKAINSWAKLYEKEWEKLGDDCLPASDLRSIIPFAVLSAARDQIEFRLMVLGSDSSLQLFEGDSLKDQALFKPMTNASADGISQQVKWKGMAYWNNQIVGYDDADNTWNLSPDFAKYTFTAADRQPIEPIAELTATDVGPVGVRSDGYLYRRFVEMVKEPPKDGQETPKGDVNIGWRRWLKQDGVTNLGVASPGVRLDLHLLTSTLRSRYIETQTSLYPVVNKLHAFALTHGVYLNQLSKAAEDYAAADDNIKKQAKATKEGKKFVSHAKVWSKILVTQSSQTKGAVNIMTSELKSVRAQLDVQLTILKDKLVGLESNLKTSEESYAKLRAAFWGIVAATIIGTSQYCLSVVYVFFNGGLPSLTPV